MIDELICLLWGKFLIQDGGLRIVMQTPLRLDFAQVSNVSHWPPVVRNILGTSWWSCNRRKCRTLWVLAKQLTVRRTPISTPNKRNIFFVTYTLEWQLRS